MPISIRNGYESIDGVLQQSQGYQGPIDRVSEGRQRQGVRKQEFGW